MSCRAISLFALVALAVPGSASATQRYEGFAYAVDGQALLYRESHWLDGATRIVLYRCPDGKPFARKRVETGDQMAAPDFITDDARDGYREGVRGTAPDFEVFVRSKASVSEKSKSIDKPSNAIIDAGFDAFIIENWDSMAVGAKRSVQFLIPSRLGYMPFTISRRPDADVAGVKARRFQLKLGAWYGFALPAIDVAYAIDGKRLLQYQGLGNIRSNKGDNLSVRIEFPPARQGPAADDSIADPSAVALDGRCAL